MLRIVLDTNVLVSAIIAEGKPRDLLSLAIQKQYLLITSPPAIDEFTDVLHRPKFRMTKSEIMRARNALMTTGKIVTVTSRRKIVEEDPDDDVLINTALSGNANYIVSGDPHLLALSEYKGIKILMVSDMLKRFGL